MITLGLQLTLASLRWQRIAEFGGGHLSAGRAVLYTLIGSFFSQVLPSTVGGDAARIWLLARDAGAWKNAIYLGSDRSNCRVDLACCTSPALPALVARADR